MRIGGGSGFWGDTSEGARQLVERGDIDVLMLDYLAEITMSILTRMRMKSPDAGYATDFVDHVMAPLATQIAAKGIKVIANAGGVNPLACKAALEKMLAEKGVALKVAVVLGDDIMPIVSDLRSSGAIDTETGSGIPARVVSANVYLGAFPIAEALRRGADVVITGRCVDSALALGPMIAKFGWTPADLDKLSQGSLAGHILECGVQGSGGGYTDWHLVEQGYAEMGFPIVEVDDTGSFIVTKPAGTGGLVTPATIGEQVVYEVHDPARYLLPDVACDWSRVSLVQEGDDRVRVTNARGFSAPPTYKASLTHLDGFRVLGMFMIAGHEARAKAERVGAAIIERANRINAAKGLAPFRSTSVELIGSESQFGAASQARNAREVVMTIGARHDDQSALQTLGREIAPAATSMVQSITGFAGGRPSPTPVVRLASVLVPKERVTIEIAVGETRETLLPLAPTTASAPAPIAPIPSVSLTGVTRDVPLRWLAHGRSGDKGNTANIGILARRPEYVDAIRAALTADRVKTYFAHFVEGDVTRFEWPGLNGWNFVCLQALGGGGIASLRFDPQGKAYAQILLEMPIAVPSELAVHDPDIRA